MNAQKRTRQNPLAGEYKFPNYGPSKTQLERYRKIVGIPEIPQGKGPSVSVISALRIEDVCIVRFKKLKGGRQVIRNLRKIKQITVDFKEIENSREFNLTATFDTKDGAGELQGIVSFAAGKLKINVLSFTPKGYTKGRNFSVVGYTPSAIINTPTRRSNPQA